MHRYIHFVGLFCLILSPVLTLAASSTINFELPLSAANFFEPIRNSHHRNPNWPEHLTLEKQILTREQLKAELMKHQWRNVYSCGGRPTYATILSFNGKADGFLNPGYQMSFSDTTAKREVFRYDDSSPVTAKDHEMGDFEASYDVVTTARGHLEVEYSNGIVDGSPELVLVKETNELLIQTHSGVFCDGGLEAMSLWVPVNLLY